MIDGHRDRGPESVLAVAVERLRTMSDARLARAHPRGGTVADAGHLLSVRVVGWTDELAALRGEAGSAGVPLPRLGDLATGDQLAVVGADLLRAISRDDRSAARIATLATLDLEGFVRSV